MVSPDFLAWAWVAAGLYADYRQEQRLDNLLDIARNYARADFGYRYQMASAQAIQEIIQRDQNEHLQTGQ